ncbi:hypothetical protein PSTT_06411, partial [Puccinia striiformis]
MAERPPAISTTFCDLPTQRLYVVSVFVLIQAYKLIQFLDVIWSGSFYERRKLWIYWSLIDILLIGFVIPSLRIPRLRYDIFQKSMILSLLVFVNWFWSATGICNLISLGLSSKIHQQFVQLPDSHHGIQALQSSILQANAFVYQQQPLRLCSLRNVTHAQLHPLTKQKKTQKSLEDWLEDEENDQPLDNDDRAQSNQNLRSKPQQLITSGELKLSPTQHLYNLNIYHIGVIRLERVLDKDNMDIRIARTEALVVECPSASFSSDPVNSGDKKFAPWPSSSGPKENHKCIGDSENFGLFQIVNGQRKLVKLEGITSGEFFTPLTSIDTSTLAEKLSKSHRPEYTWAESNSIDIPLNLKDACGHRFDFDKNRDASSIFARQDYIDSKSVQVHSRGQISFVDCGNTDDEPLRLLQGKSVTLRMAIRQQSEMPDPPWKQIFHRFGIETSSAWTKELVFNDLEKTFLAREAGVYEITSLQGIIEQPTPTIDLNFTSITDKCSGEIGLQANFLLTGKPPFKLHYLISQLGRHPQTKSKIIQHSRDEILIQPDSPGQFEYSFVRLDDQYYKGVEIVGKTIKQTVHPLAHARFVRGGKDENIWSCSGESVEADIELRRCLSDLGGRTARDQRDFIEPCYLGYCDSTEIHQKEGGHSSIKDGNGCLRNLTVSDLNIEVHRTKPTLKFYGSGNERKIIAREGDMVAFPMRLTGNGVSLSIKGASDKNLDLLICIVFCFGSVHVVHGANDDLLVDQAGQYTLKSVHDRHCPGTVENPTFSLEWIPKPSLMISPHNSGDLIRGVWVKPPSCELTDDSIELTLEGTPPFSVTYSVLRKPLGRGEKVVNQSKTIQILKPSGTLPMQTLEPGQYTYTIHSLNDHLVWIIEFAKDWRYSNKTEVLASPQGALSLLPRTTYCVEESLSAQANKGVKIELTGKAPFEVEIEVRNQVTQVSKNFKLQLQSTSSMLDLPYKFSSASPHSIKIKSLEDSSKCKSIPSSTDTLLESSRTQKSQLPVTIEVAEIASIKPINDKPYFCVGENLEFLLKGSAPWLIKYEFNGHQSKINVNSQSRSKFSRLAQEPGLFKLLEISSSSSASSKIPVVIMIIIVIMIYFIEDIREGDQSEITFTFEGTPPFSFTYIRTISDESSSSTSTSKKSNGNNENSKSGGSGERILETKTITDIFEHSYSIFTKQEGTWSVTFIKMLFARSLPSPKINHHLSVIMLTKKYPNPSVLLAFPLIFVHQHK